MEQEDATGGGDVEATELDQLMQDIEDDKALCSRDENGESMVDIKKYG